ncbi:MAG: radical SAM protein [Planctomycetes bacterium]|nr:radical SAM protein [Planctomycetota bacterium]NOG54144.1 radical SAM protein [Planctomycetota bacterium]
MKSTTDYPPPRLVFWETTAGCNLRCIHCRRITVAEELMPQDLTTEESYKLIDQVADIGSPVFVLSGGEPMFRPDIYDIARYATKAGLPVALATNGTLIGNLETAEKIRDSGVKRVSISFDGADAATHDAFRGLPGSFDEAIKGFKLLREVGLPVQINTTIAKHNQEQLTGVLALAKDLDAIGLHLFLLVPVGCGTEIAEDQMISAVEYERVLDWLHRTERSEPGLQLKATCAPHYFRVMHEHKIVAKKSGDTSELPPSHHRQVYGHLHGKPGMPVNGAPKNGNGGHPGGGHPGGGHPGGGHDHQMHAATKGCLAGTGVCFVSHRGEVFPCGYLPVEAGNVREKTFGDIWQNSKLFAELRDPDQLGGKCGECQYVRLCSGCRARAYGTVGDYLAEEPFCAYDPKTRSIRIAPQALESGDISLPQTELI